MNFLTPKEIAESAVDAGERKARLSILNLVLLGVLAGAFTGFGAAGSTLAAHDLPSFGLTRWVSGLVFATGLMLVVLAGAELFTGNTLMVLSLYDRRITWGQMLRNWFWVYLANLLGSLLVVWLIWQGGLWELNSAQVGATAVRIAYGKVALPFGQAFARGVLANWLVCLAVWIAWGAKDVSGKIFGILFPISLFVLSAYEHSVANMYFIPAGIFAKGSPAVAAASGLSAEQLALLNAGGFLQNLIPVTLGNIVGGAVMVGTAYWLTFRYGVRAEKGQAQTN